MNEQDLLKLQNGSDVRGVAAEGVPGESVNLTAAAANVIGQAFAAWLAKRLAKPVADLTLGVGRDARITGESLAEAFAKGASKAGTRVTDCGLATTPAMFMSIVFDATRFDGAVMITASHLPFNRNGIKFFWREGGLEASEVREVLDAAAKLSEAEDAAPFAEACDLMSLYVDHLKATICRELGADEDARPLAGLHIVVDAGNGDAGFFARRVLAPLGADTTGSVFLDPDGMFPNHIPNPENAKAMASIQKATVESRADLGLIFDTDVDRMSAVFSSGQEVNRDSIIALISAILAPDFPGGTIITDSVTSDRLTVFLEQKLGLKHLRYRRGYKNVIDKCKELNAAGVLSPLAMETSGHGALRDNYYLDDGAFLAVKLVISLAREKREGKRLEDLIADLPPAGAEGEWRFRIRRDDFKGYGREVLAEFERRARKADYNLPQSYEGVRISFNDADRKGWLLLRMSLHDPVMPLNIEGETEADRAKILETAKELLKGFDALDMGGV